MILRMAAVWLWSPKLNLKAEHVVGAYFCLLFGHMVLSRHSTVHYTLHKNAIGYAY